MSKRKDIDWPAIERDFRIGQLTMREIARQHDVDVAAISRKAKKLGWTQDLTEEVKTRTRAALLTKDVNAPSTDVNTALAADLDLAVETNVAIVLGHRSRIRNLNELEATLVGQLKEAAEKREEIEADIEDHTAGDKNGERRTRLLRAVSLPSHAGVLKELSTVAKTSIGLERQAFNLGDKGGSDPDVPPASGGKVEHTLDAKSLELLKRLLE